MNKNRDTETREETLDAVFTILTKAMHEDIDTYRKALITAHVKLKIKANAIEQTQKQKNKKASEEDIIQALKEYVAEKGLTCKNPNEGPFKHEKNIYIFLDQFIEYIESTKIKLDAEYTEKTISSKRSKPSKKAIGKVLRNAGGFQQTLGFTNGSKSTTRSTYNVSNLITYD